MNNDGGEVLSKKDKMLKQLKADYILYLMLFPTILYFIIFRVLPIYNMRLAFFDYRINGDWQFQGLKYFKIIFGTPMFKNLLINTLTISFLKYVVMFPFFVLFAILLNELKSKKFKNTVQVVSYLPHFLSWVVIAGIWISMLSPTDGIVNEIRVLAGYSPIDFVTSKDHILGVLFFSEMWRSLGWDSIIFLVAINGISPSLFESACIDGASRFKTIIHITLPMLIPAMVTVFVLNLGFFLNAGLDQVFNFSNPAVDKRIDIIDTYIYRIGVLQGNYSLGTAVGLIKGVFGTILVVITHYVAKAYSGKGVW